MKLARQAILASVMGAAMTMGGAAQAMAIAHWSFDYAPVGAEKNTYMDTMSQRSAIAENKDNVLPYAGTDAPFGKAITLNGQAGSYLNVPVSVPFQNKSFTIAVWVNVTAAGKPNLVVADWDKDKTAYAFGFDTPKATNKLEPYAELRSPVMIENKAKTKKYNASVVKATVDKDVPLASWHHLAFVWDRADATHGTLTTYLDGEKIGETKNKLGNGVLSAEALDYHNGFQIGMKKDTNNGFIGSLDELWIFNEALTAQQISNLMKTNDIAKDKLEVAQLGSGDAATKPAEAVAMAPADGAGPATPTPAVVTPTPALNPNPVVVAPTPAPIVVAPTPVAPTPVAVAPVPLVPTVTPTPTPAITPTPAVVAAAPPVAAVEPKSIPREITQVPPVLAVASMKSYSPERIAGIVSTAVLACGLAGFLAWAKGEKGKMKGRRA